MKFVSEKGFVRHVLVRNGLALLKRVVDTLAHGLTLSGLAYISSPSGLRKQYIVRGTFPTSVVDTAVINAEFVVRLVHIHGCMMHPPTRRYEIVLIDMDGWHL